MKICSGLLDFFHFILVVNLIYFLDFVEKTNHIKLKVPCPAYNSVVSLLFTS